MWSGRHPSAAGAPMGQQHVRLVSDLLSPSLTKHACAEGRLGGCQMGVVLVDKVKRTPNGGGGCRAGFLCITAYSISAGSKVTCPLPGTAISPERCANQRCKFGVCEQIRGGRGFLLHRPADRDSAAGGGGANTHLRRWPGMRGALETKHLRANRCPCFKEAARWKGAWPAAPLPESGSAPAERCFTS